MSRVLVPLAAGFEELEAITVTDLLRRAGLTVVTAGLDGQIQRGSRGAMLLPDTALEAALTHEFDMLVLPGGQPGTNNLKADERILNLVRKMAGEGRYVAAICAAPSVLAHAGVLDGKRATSFPGSLDAYPQVHRLSDAVVEDGRIITSRGPGTAMDFALTLVERLCGKQKRDEVEAGLQR